MIKSSSIICTMIFILMFLCLTGCSFGEKFNKDEDEGKIIKILVIFTPDAAVKLINPNSPETVDLNLIENREIIESKTLQMISTANYINTNSAITHKIELVDGDLSDEMKSYILDIDEEKIIQEAKSTDSINCPNVDEIGPWRFLAAENYSKYFLDCRYLEWLNTSQMDRGLIYDLRDASKADIVVIVRDKAGSVIQTNWNPFRQTCTALSPGDSSSGDQECINKTGNPNYMCILNDEWGKEPSKESTDGKCYWSAKAIGGMATQTGKKSNQELLPEIPFITLNFNAIIDSSTLNHELGHLMGLSHDYITASSNPNNFKQGHLDFNNKSIYYGGIGTTMTYESSCTLQSEKICKGFPFYSNHLIEVPIFNENLEPINVKLGIDNNSNFSACHIEQIGEFVSKWYEFSSLGNEDIIKNSYLDNCIVEPQKMSNYNFVCHDANKPSIPDPIYHGCTKIIGNLITYRDELIDTNQIISLDNNHSTFHFNALKVLDGDMTIEGIDESTNESKLINFSHLEKVNGNFSIRLKNGVNKVTFPKLDEVSGDFRISINENLGDVEIDFPKLKLIKGTLFLTGHTNDNSTNVRSINFNSLEQIKGRLYIFGNSFSGQEIITTQRKQNKSTPLRGATKFLKNKDLINPKIYPEHVTYKFPKLKIIGEDIYIKYSKLKSLVFINQINEVKSKNIYIKENNEMTNCDLANLDMDNFTTESNLGFDCNGL